MLETVIELFQFTAGGGEFPVQQIQMPQSARTGFWNSVPWDRMWDAIIVAGGALLASIAAWWRALSRWKQVLIAFVGIAIVALLIVL